jgi:hypothetical protein
MESLHLHETTENSKSSHPPTHDSDKDKDKEQQRLLTVGRKPSLRSPLPELSPHSPKDHPILLIIAVQSIIPL